MREASLTEPGRVPRSHRRHGAHVPVNALRVAALLTAMTSALACGDSGDPPPRFRGTPMQIQSQLGTLRISGSPPVRGINAYDIELVNAADTEVVAVSAFMPAHGHGTDSVALSHRDGVARAEPVKYFMPGLWEVRIDLKSSDRRDFVTFRVDVP